MTKAETQKNYKIVNRYECPSCKTAWEDTHDCACNDKCPRCNKEIEPYDSEEIEA